MTQRHADPLDFQPALLRLQGEPPSPLPRAILRTLVTLVVGLILWAAFGRLDVVAVVHGKLVPQSYAKIVQPAEQGIVREILVREGQRVAQGEVLMRMDPAFSDADLRALQSELHTNRLIVRRTDAQLSGSHFERESDDPIEHFADAHARFLADRSAFESALAVERAALERARSELDAALQRRDKLDALLPSYIEEEQAFRELVEQGLAGRLAATEKTRERIGMEQDLRTQQHAVVAAQSTIAEIEQRIAQIRMEQRRSLEIERAEATQRLSGLEQQLAKQVRRQEFLELKAPQDGIATDLATHTIGTVVSPGTVLMTVVPVDEALRAEVWVGNEDVGFVYSGQPVRVKLATFQFQKYGMLEGSVATVSADAVTAEEDQTARAGRRGTGLLYKTLVDLKTPHLDTEVGRFELAPGMQVTAEVQLGRRTVLEYIFSPVSRAFQEAGRER